MCAVLGDVPDDVEKDEEEGPERDAELVESSEGRPQTAGRTVRARLNSCLWAGS